jgi:mono/diheme cytochrome c family protein
MRGAWTALAAGFLLTACSDAGSLSPAAQRGREVYLAQCGACHHPSDPAKAGALGPPIKGTARAVLEAKVLKGAYPPGYTPKRESRVMQPMPALAPDIEALSEFLK